MGRSNQPLLHLKISDRRGVFRRTLRRGECLRFGTAPTNDVQLFDGEFPGSTVLIENLGDKARLYLHPKMTGAVVFRESTLTFRDLMNHDLLPSRKGYFLFTLLPGRRGAVKIGEAEVAFLFGEAAVPTLPPYDWRAALGKAWRRDLLFKTVLLLLLSVEGFLALRLRGISLPPETPPPIEKVPQRFARFVVRAPQPPPAVVSNTEANAAPSGGEGSPRSSAPRQGGGGVASTGLLGLIGAKGGGPSAAADFLIDQGLIKQLDEIMGTTTVLQRGGGRTASAAATAEASALPSLPAGIDDLIDKGGVSGVELQKQGSVSIQALQAVRGSEEARGRRSAESVMAVINAQRGRVMYAYNKYLRLNPDLGGKVSFDVTIAADGRVTDVRVVETSVESAEFIAELISILKSLRFPAIQEGSVTVNVPFVFHRVG